MPGTAYREGKYLQFMKFLCVHLQVQSFHIYEPRNFTVHHSTIDSNVVCRKNVVQQQLFSNCTYFCGYLRDTNYAKLCAV